MARLYAAFRAALTSRPSSQTVALLVGLIQATSAVAQIVSEGRLNDYAPNGQRFPSVAASPEGDFVVVWSSWAQDGDTYGIYGKKFGAGAPFQGVAEFRVNSFTTNDQRLPSVTVQADGGFVVVWEGYPLDGDGSGVFARFFDSLMTPRTTDFRVNVFTTGSQRTARVKVAPDQSAFVVWESIGQDGSESGVYGRRYSSVGIPSGSEFRVNSYTSGAQLSPTLAVGQDGTALVAWHSVGQDGSLTGVYGQLFDSAGQPAGAEFQVNAYTYWNQYAPLARAMPDGDFLVVWRENTSSLRSGNFARRVSVADGPVGAEFQLATADRMITSFTVDPWGDLTSTYVDGGKVFARRVDVTGVPVAADFQINCSGTRPVGDVTVEAAAGYFATIWSRHDHDLSTDWNVLGKRHVYREDIVFADGFDSETPRPQPCR